MNNITVNIVEPGSGPTPIDPVVPNTGLFTHGIGGPEATIITVSIVAIIAIIVALVLYYKKKHSKDNTANKVDKAEKATKLAKTISTLKAKKKVSIPLAALALVVSLGTLTALLVNAGKSNTSAAEGDNSLTVTESSEDLTIEVADSPVFAVLPVELTVEEATEAGYTLTAYTDNTDLVSTTDGSKVIPMVAADEGELVALADNTYGLRLSQPTSQDDEVYTVLSTDAGNPTFITDKDYEGTGENDKTTIYYGFYITPDTPHGTYEGGDIYYEATANEVATVTFNGNGLYFNGDEAKTTNTVKYIPGRQSAPQYSHTPNVNDEGVQDGKYGTDLNETFVYSFPEYDEVNFHIIKISGDAPWTVNGDYLSIWPGDKPNNTALEDWNSEDSIKELGSDGKYKFTDNSRDYNDKSILVKDNTITVSYTTDSDSGGGGGSGYGYYASVIGLVPNVTVSGEYETPATTIYREYQFLGWSIDPDANTAIYQNADEVATYLDLRGDDVVLYAVWSPIVDISYDGNNATVGSMQSTSYNGDTPITITLTHEDKIAGDNIDLYAPNYKKGGYGFAGWSTDQTAWEDLTDDDETNNPTIYGPNQSFTMTKDMALDIEDGDMILYAVWAPAETDNNGNPVYLQDWQGCSTLTPTTYDSNTGTLSVGKNTITALTDNRDGNIYTVARLADGNCWMTENLRLDSDAIITNINTNHPLIEGGNVAIKNNDGSTSAHLSPNSNRWCTGYGSDCIDQSNLNIYNINLGGEGAIASYNGSNDNTRAFQWHSYGNNYNWYSATAGRGNVSKTFGEVIGDICPAGWRLPVGSNNNTSGSFYYLNQQMGQGQSSSDSNNWRSFPNNFIYSGRWNGSTANNRGYVGFYWSSTAYSLYRAYLLYFDSGYVSPGTDNNKSNGYSVRCVAPVQ